MNKRTAPGTTKVKADIQEVAKKHYDYEDLAEAIRAHIVKQYGSIKSFIDHDDFTVKCGFAERDRGTSSMYTYLSSPRKEGERKTARSFPVIQKLYKGLLGVELASQMVIKRSQEITAPAEKQLDKILQKLIPTAA